MAVEVTEGMKLHLGCGKSPMPGWVNLDLNFSEGVDCVADLGQLRGNPLPYPEGTFSQFLGSHVIEHIPDTLGMMQELWRVARDGATATFRLPYGSSDDAWEDQTHVRPWFMGSFLPFQQPYYWRADYGYRGDWNCKRILLLVEGAKYRGFEAGRILHDVHHFRNVVQEMTVELVAVKPAREQKRELLEQPRIEIGLV